MRTNGFFLAVHTIMFDISFSELFIIAVIALIVLGPERLPKVARTLGHLLGRAQRYVHDVKRDIQKEMDLSEVQNIKKEMQEASTSVKQSISDLESELKDPLEEAQSAIKELGEDTEKIAQKIQSDAEQVAQNTQKQLDSTKKTDNKNDDTQKKPLESAPQASTEPKES